MASYESLPWLSIARANGNIFSAIAQMNSKIDPPIFTMHSAQHAAQLLMAGHHSHAILSLLWFLDCQIKLPADWLHRFAPLASLVFVFLLEFHWLRYAFQYLPSVFLTFLLYVQAGRESWETASCCCFFLLLTCIYEIWDPCTIQSDSVFDADWNRVISYFHSRLQSTQTPWRG